MNKRKIVIACTALTMGMAAVAGARVQTQVVIPPEQTKPVVAPDVTIHRVELKPTKRTKSTKQKKAKAAKVKKATPALQLEPSAAPLPGVSVAPTAAAPRVVFGVPVNPVPATPRIGVPSHPSAVAPLPGVQIAPAPAAVAVPASYRFFGAQAPSQKASKAPTAGFFEYKKAQDLYQRVYSTANIKGGVQSLGKAKAPSSTFYNIQKLQGTYKTLEPAKFKGKALNGAVFYSTQTTGSLRVSDPAKRVDDPHNYQNMKGEDRPDWLTHPMGVGTVQDPAKSRWLASPKSRTATRALGVELTSRLKAAESMTINRTNVERYNLARAIESRVSTTNLDKVKRLSDLATTRSTGTLIPKDNLDKATEYRLKYNSETKQWEVIPVTKSGKG